MIMHRDVMNRLPEKCRRTIEARATQFSRGRESARTSPSSWSADHRQRGNLEEALSQPDRRIQSGEGAWHTGLPPRRQKPLLGLALDEYTQLIAVLSHSPHGDRIHTSETCEVSEKFLLRTVLRAGHWFQSIVVLHCAISLAERESRRADI